MIVNCENCNKEFNCCPSRFYKNKHHCCSVECSQIVLKKERESKNGYFNCKCKTCGKPIHLKPYAANRYDSHYCCKECYLKALSDRMVGEKNHQFGLKGSKNSSWKSDFKISSYGYKMQRVLDHPFANSDGFVFCHRLVAEEFLLDDTNSVIVNDKRYLNPELDVHHIDEDKTNNDVSNLMILTKGEHRRLHNLLNVRERDSLGRFKKSAS